MKIDFDGIQAFVVIENSEASTRLLNICM